MAVNQLIPMLPYFALVSLVYRMNSCFDLNMRYFALYRIKQHDKIDSLNRSCQYQALHATFSKQKTKKIILNLIGNSIVILYSIENMQVPQLTWLVHKRVGRPDQEIYCNTMLYCLGSYSIVVATNWSCLWEEWGRLEDKCFSSIASS